jgi:hypothetical protein
MHMLYWKKLKAEKNEAFEPTVEMQNVIATLYGNSEGDRPGQSETKLPKNVAKYSPWAGILETLRNRKQAEEASNEIKAASAEMHRVLDPLMKEWKFDIDRFAAQYAEKRSKEEKSFAEAPKISPKDGCAKIVEQLEAVRRAAASLLEP